MLYIILALSVIGIILCAYIYSTKKRGKALVCAIGTDCNKVLYSEYSAVFGISLEVIGAFYYASLAMLSGMLILSINSVFIFDINVLFAIISAIGAFFSLIFMYTQAVLIKDWCEYCLVSAGLSLIIFLIKFFV